MLPRKRLQDPLRLALAIFAVSALVGAFWIIPDRGSDFRAFYESGRAWGLHRPAYVVDASAIPNLTPPLLLPLFWLFAQAPFGVAFATWTCLSLACAAACLPVLERRTGYTRLDVLLLVLGTAPAAITLGLGQVGFVLLALLTVAWDATPDHPVRAGVCVGLLCVLKPFYGLVALWYLWRRAWRSVGAMAAVGVGAIILSVLVAPADCLAWIRALRTIGWTANLYNAAITGIGARLFTPTVDTGAALWTPLVVSPLYASLTTLIGRLLVSGVTLIALRRAPDDEDRAFAVLSVAGVLLAPLAWVHYLPASLGPVLAATRSRRLGSVALALACVPYGLLLHRVYGPVGTLLAGSWACVLTLVTLALACHGIGIGWRASASTTLPAIG